MILIIKYLTNTDGLVVNHLYRVLYIIKKFLKPTILDQNDQDS